jgi:O-antigen ligase
MDEVLRLGKTKVNHQLYNYEEELPLALDLRFVFYLFIASIPAEMFEIFIRTSMPKLLGFIFIIIVAVRGKWFLRMPTAPFYFFLIYYGFILISIEWINPFFFSYWKMRVFQLTQLLFFMWVSSYLINYKKVMIGAIQSYSYSLVTLFLLATLRVPGFVAEEAEEIYSSRATIGRVDPNAITFMLGVPFLYFVNQMLNYYKERNKIRYRYIFVLGYLLFEIINAGSRGGQIAILCSLVALLVTKDYAIKKINTFLIILFIILIFSVVALFTPKMSQRWGETIYEGKMSGREKIWPESIKMIKRKPLLGYGPGEHIYILGPATGKEKRDSHSSFIWVLHEVGILGGSPFIIGFILSGVMAFRKRKGYLENLPLALWILALVANNNTTSLYSKTTWFILAVASSMERKHHF